MEANQNYQDTTEPQKPLSAAALWGFIFSLLGILVIPLLAAIPLSIIGLVKTSGGKMRGCGLAWAGVIISLCTPIFVAVLAIIAAIAIPNLLENQRMSNENAAQATLRSIVTAQGVYTTMNKRYAPNLAALVDAGMLNRQEFTGCTEPGYDSRIISGYLFQMTAGRTWTSASFYVRCRPESPTAGRECFATDTSARIVTTRIY